MAFWLQLIATSIILIVAAISVASMIKATKSFAPWIPSNHKMVAQALELIKITPDTRFVDLGCGDGRVLLYVKKKYNCKACGYEQSIIPYFFAILRRLISRQNDIQIFFKNLFDADLGKYNVIFIYGLPENINKKLLPKIDKEIKPGTYLISYNFSLHGKEPMKKLHQGWRNTFIYKF